ncbi:MAG: T9SS type A sorting domain-containing protein, partial [Bacteroidetes bacterium]|nr:T9SS type A sorting domain-containing protein [Bacteroidota bacterium]
KVSTCGSTWEFAVNYARIFGLQLPVFPPEEKGIALQLYPNPADQQFIVQLPPNSNNGYRIILYDLFGRTVREIRTSVAQHDDTGKELSLVVHAADLPEGLFVLHCECNGLVTARKLMIHH